MHLWVHRSCSTEIIAAAVTVIVLAAAAVQAGFTPAPETVTVFKLGMLTEIHTVTLSQYQRVKFD